MKCGYIAIIGRSNAGKSSLANRIIEEEVAVVSHRKQTTRNNILGIANIDDAQLVFIDTPGIHHSKNKLDKYMMKNVRLAISMADVLIYLIDISSPLDDEEKEYIEMLKSQTQNLIIVANKIDKKQNAKIDADINISVKENIGIDKLIEKIIELLPEQEKIYDDEVYTDKSIKFLICEHLRGILLDKFDNEIPHGVGIYTESFLEDENIAKIEISIVCEQERHKGIIIGKKGANLKEIGILTREYAESLLEKKVFVKLFVKVDENWRDKNISKYGYEI